ncbi:MAG: hypothetical protein K2G03_02110 [Bacilli bacterium]|nr:hypothetical protein [Bacilli bacterium]
MVKKIECGSIYYSFNYLLPDLILDIVLIRQFIYKQDKKDVNRFNVYLNMINFFYSSVVDALKECLTEIRFNKVKNGLEEAIMSEKYYVPQWFEMISIDYANMNKKKREKEMMHTLDAIYNYHLYTDYLECKMSVEKFSEENNCKINDVHNNGISYPDEVIW